MHNKFFIIDKRFIWTGSANISDTGVGGYNANIVGVLDSIYFARFYTQEFEQMYTLGDHHRQKNQLKKWLKHSEESKYTTKDIQVHNYMHWQCLNCSIYNN